MPGVRAYLRSVQPPARQIPGIKKKQTNNICLHRCYCFFFLPLCTRSQTLDLLD